MRNACYTQIKYLVFDGLRITTNMVKPLTSVITTLVGGGRDKNHH